ncbi:MAG TPA: hypothetical protein VFI70_01000 [Nitrososphaeraceae archaeon]|nr:hypothetical protein [Nitrososphaeraceae archaeon]
MTINNVEEDNTVDQLRRFKDTHNKKIKTDNDNNNKQSEKASWWINELDSLGIKKSNYNKTESNYLQNLEDLSDNKKQDFIRDYKIWYSECM